MAASASIASKPPSKSALCTLNASAVSLLASSMFSCTYSIMGRSLEVQLTRRPKTMESNSHINRAANKRWIKTIIFFSTSRKDAG